MNNQHNTSLENIKLLLIEDDNNVREALKLMLNEMGIVKITEFDNGLDPLKFIDEGGYSDIILCDWNIPKKTGIEFLREVRQTQPFMPFIMITARADKNSVSAAKEAEVTAYISKPVSFEDLETKIRYVLKR